MDAAHGSELVCSYPACRNSGVRFLFCTYCDAAISRRGFKTKHVHDDLQRSEAEGGGRDHIIMPSFVDKKRKESFRNHSRDSLGDSSQEEDSSLEGGVADGSTKVLNVGVQNAHKKQKGSGESLRMKELKRDWTRLLTESRDHVNGPDAEGKRALWLQKVESIYDEYSNLRKFDL
jgi:hypothetical protein